MSTVAANKLSNVSKTKQIDVDALIDKANGAAVAADLASPLKGANMVGWNRQKPIEASTTVGGVLSTLPINIWEYAHLVVSKPTALDPTTWDWAPAVQAANNYIRSQFNTYGPGCNNVLDFPGGKYPIRSKVTISPFVKLRSQGMVVFLTAVPGTSAFHFTPSAGDYSSNTAVVGQQQWWRGPFINGTSGGFVFRNTLARSGCTGIEIGATSDVGALTPTSRYSVVHFAVEEYAVAVKMNRFRNYIGYFGHVHLENNDEAVVFGESTLANVTDSGENIAFDTCVFAKVQTAFRWYCDGFDVNFINCSFDYIGTIFWFSRLYKKITVVGGHMEGIGGARAHDGIGGIVLEDSVHSADRGTICYVTIEGVSAFITVGQMIRASSKTHVSLDLDLRKMGTANSPDGVFFCTPDVVLRKRNLVIQHRTSYPSWSVNTLRNPLFKDETDGAAMYPNGPVGWKPVVSSFPAVISPDASSLGGKSIAITGGATGSYYSIDSVDKYPCTAGDVVQAGLFVKFAVGADLATAGVLAAVYFYDVTGALILTTPGDLNLLGGSALTAGVYCTHAYSRQGVAPPGATHYTVRLGVSGAAMNNVVTYITGLYATILK